MTMYLSFYITDKILPKTLPVKMLRSANNGGSSFDLFIRGLINQHKLVPYIRPQDEKAFEVLKQRFNAASSFTELTLTLPQLEVGDSIAFAEYEEVNGEIQFHFSHWRLRIDKQ